MFSKRLCVSFAAVAMLGAMAPGLYAQTASDGEPIYSDKCASCHRRGSPVGAPVLETVVSYSFARFRTHVWSGIDVPDPGTDMPAFLRSEIPERDVCSLYLYVRRARPDAAGETMTVCGFKPPREPAPDPGGSSGAPPPPPPPSDPALEASRRHFAPARTTAYRLQCQGGDSAAAVMMSGSDGSTSDHPAWRYQLGFLEGRIGTSLRRGTCIWVGPAPPGAGGTSAYRLSVEWNSALSPAFQTMSYRAVDQKIRVDADRRLLYTPLYRELVEAVSRPGATFAFEVWYPATAGGRRGSEYRVSAAAVRLGTDR